MEFKKTLIVSCNNLCSITTSKVKNLKGVNFTVLIPARGGSKRLQRKNIHPFLGKPMILWTIDACWRSRYVKKNSVFVSTDDEEIAKVCRNYGAEVFKRPVQQAQDKTPLIVVLRYFAKKCLLANAKERDAMICMQPNVPSRASDTLDRCIELYLSSSRSEVRVYDQNGIETGSVWIINLRHLFDKGLSTYMGAVIDPAIEVHTLEDLKKAEEKMQNFILKGGNRELCSQARLF